MPRKKAKKQASGVRVLRYGTMSLSELVKELGKALSAPLEGTERRTFTVRVATAKQRKPKRKARR
jgi:hypothetical protein